MSLEVNPSEIVIRHEETVGGIPFKSQKPCHMPAQGSATKFISLVPGTLRLTEFTWGASDFYFLGAAGQLVH